MILSILDLVEAKAPANISLCPPRYFVALWIIISIPKSEGFWFIGLEKVLSIIEIKLFFFDRFEIAYKSITFNDWLLGDSIKIILVFSLISISYSLISKLSTREYSILNFLNSLITKFRFPP